MLNAISLIAQEFLENTKNKPVRIITHHDTDGITSAAIIIRALRRAERKFSLKIIKGTDKQTIENELKRNKKEIILFLDLASNNLDSFQNLENPIFILDHHEVQMGKLNPKIKMINPHLFSEEEICGAGICYLFAKSISEKNKDLSSTAIIGMIGDRHETNLSKLYQQILNDTEDIEIKKSLLIFSAMRPLRRSLEYSSSFYIPGVTGSSQGVVELLREDNISPEKTLYELNEEEVSRLITSILMRMSAGNEKADILGNIYIMKFFSKKEDVRELSVLINACSRLGHSDIALSFALQHEHAKDKAQEIYAQYKQELVHALKNIEEMDKIQGNGFIILNAKDKIKDTIIGTVTSILSSSLDYKQGTILIGMAYNEDKIKISARIAGRGEQNLKDVLERAIVSNHMQAEVGGHQRAAGCLIKKEDESMFIEELKKVIEIDIVKI